MLDYTDILRGTRSIYYYFGMLGGGIALSKRAITYESKGSTGAEVAWPMMSARSARQI